MQQATADQGNHVTPERLDDRLDAVVAKLQAEMAKSEMRIIRWVFAAVGLAVALLRFMG